MIQAPARLPVARLPVARLSVSLLASLLLFPAAAIAQDAGAGGALFRQRCQACHSVAPGQKGLIAPNLSGVAGRKAGSTAFNYSPALKTSGLVWDKGTLDRFLLAPMKMVPGTRMVTGVPDGKQRADMVAYLFSLK